MTSVSVLQDQPTLQALLESTLSSGLIYEEDWRDMVSRDMVYYGRWRKWTPTFLSSYLPSYLPTYLLPGQVGYLYDEKDAAALCRELRRSATQLLSKESPKPSVIVMGGGSSSGSGPPGAAGQGPGQGSAHSNKPGAARTEDTYSGYG